MQSTSWETLGWKKHKLESRLPGEISITSDMQMTPSFPGSSDGKRICLQCRRPGFDSWVKKIPWRRKWQSTPVLLPGKSHGWRSLVDYSPWGRRESDTTEWLHFRFHLACKLIKQGNNIQLWHTPFSIWKQSVVPCPVLTVASWPTYRFLRRQVTVCCYPYSQRLWHSQ